MKIKSLMGMLSKALLSAAVVSLVATTVVPAGRVYAAQETEVIQVVVEDSESNDNSNDQEKENTENETDVEDSENVSDDVQNVEKTENSEDNVDSKDEAGKNSEDSKEDSAEKSDEDSENLDGAKKDAESDSAATLADSEDASENTDNSRNSDDATDSSTEAISDDATDSSTEAISNDANVASDESGEEETDLLTEEEEEESEELSEDELLMKKLSADIIKTLNSAESLSMLGESKAATSTATTEAEDDGYVIRVKKSLFGYDLQVEITNAGLDEIVIDLSGSDFNIQPDTTLTFHFIMNNSEYEYEAEYQFVQDGLVRWAYTEAFQEEWAVPGTVQNVTKDGRAAVQYMPTSVVNVNGRSVLNYTDNIVRYFKGQAWPLNDNKVAKEPLTGTDSEVIAQITDEKLLEYFNDMTGGEYTDVYEAWTAYFYANLWKTTFNGVSPDVYFENASKIWLPGEEYDLKVVTEFSGRASNIFTNTGWNASDRLILRKVTKNPPPEPTPGPDPTPDPDPTPNPDPTPDPTPEVVPPVDVPAVLGAVRQEDVPAVLGAKRLPQTGQLWWPVPFMALVGAGLFATGLKKSRNC